MADPISGLLLLDKPSGPSSFDCVRIARRVLGERRIGHCGTLDPMAAGVLILLVGRSTRWQAEFLKMEKEYWFRGELGRCTDSGDRTGVTTGTRPAGHVTREGLEAAAHAFVGSQWQVPPRVSAIKYQGKRLYEWTRQGVTVPRPPRRVDIYRFEILSFQPPHYEARVVCSRGTYIRSLAEDLASRLGTAGTVDALTRERVGPYRRQNGLVWAALCAARREQLLQSMTSDTGLSRAPAETEPQRASSQACLLPPGEKGRE